MRFNQHHFQYLVGLYYKCLRVFFVFMRLQAILFRSARIISVHDLAHRNINDRFSIFVRVKTLNVITLKSIVFALIWHFNNHIFDYGWKKLKGHFVTGWFEIVKAVPLIGHTRDPQLTSVGLITNKLNCSADNIKNILHTPHTSGRERKC